MAFPQDTPPQVKQRTRGLGSSSTETLNNSYAGPINLSQDQFSSVDELRAFFENLVLNDNAELRAATAAYYGITGYSPDFNEAPDLETVETGPGGLPGTPYTPNVASPGPGSTNPTSLPSPPPGQKTEPSDVPFSGVPITANNPAKVSSAMAQTKVGQGVNALGQSKASE